MTNQTGKLSGTERSQTLVGSPLPSAENSAAPPASPSFPVESLWQSAFDALAEPVWLMDAECRILRCNQAARKFCGDEIVGRPCWEAVHCAHERIPSCPFPAMLQSRHRESGDLPLGARWFNCTVDPLFDAAGNISGALHILWDITDRKRAEKLLLEANETLERRVAGRTAELQRTNQSLRNSEKQLRRFIESAPVAIAMFDREMKYLAASRRWLRDYGLEGREILGRSHYDIFPEMPERWKACHQRGLAGEVLREDEDQFERADGAVQWLKWELRPWFNLGGAIGGIILFTEDITERRRAEAALRESEEKFRLLFATVTDAVLVFDAETRKFVEVNDAALRMYGYSREELQQLTAMDLTDEPAASEAAIAQTMSGSLNRIPVRYHKRKDGTIFPVEICASTFLLQGRALYCGIVRDITERKQAEAALTASAAALKQAQRLAAIGNWEWDIPSDRHTWSEEVYRIYGRDPASPPAVYPEVRQYFTPESWARLAAAVEKGLLEGTPYECDAEVARPDGTRRWITARGQITRDAAGQVVGLHGTVQDITERKRAEQLLRNANRTLQVIRDCHEAMLRAGTEIELLEEICRIIVQSGGERMAWVGFAEKNAQKSVRPVAWAGFVGEYLARARITWADKLRGRGPVGTAIRTRQVCLCHNTLTDPRFAPWLGLARRCGYGSVIALPLFSDKQCFGALSIYAAEPDAFDVGEQLLLTDLANDLAFGISTLRLRAEHERLENEILKSIEREQERIGRDLHDGLCQLLVGAKFRSVYLQKISAARPAVAKKEAKALEKMLNHAIEQARDLARGLNPVKVAPAGLAAALQKLADEVDSLHGTHCFCQFPAPVKVSDHHVACHLYRIAQEAVQNALKHARAKNISITLARREHRVVLTVKDDGAGLPPVLKKNGMGLNNMQARARLIGGRLEIHRRTHGGTAVSCELPHKTEPEP